MVSEGERVTENTLEEKENFTMPEDEVPLALPLGDNGNGVGDLPPHADNGEAGLQVPPAHPQVLQQ